MLAQGGRVLTSRDNLKSDVRRSIARRDSAVFNACDAHQSSMITGRGRPTALHSKQAARIHQFGDHLAISTRNHRGLERSIKEKKRRCRRGEWGGEGREGKRVVDDNER